MEKWGVYLGLSLKFFLLLLHHSTDCQCWCFQTFCDLLLIIKKKNHTGEKKHDSRCLFCTTETLQSLFVGGKKKSLFRHTFTTHGSGVWGKDSLFFVWEVVILHKSVTLTFSTCLQSWWKRHECDLEDGPMFTTSSIYSINKWGFQTQHQTSNITEFTDSLRGEFKIHLYAAET